MTQVASIWGRRAAAVGILVAMCLPMVTLRGCGGGVVKLTGWELVDEFPQLASLPIFAVCLLWLSLVAARSVIGRVVAPLLRIALAAGFALWTGVVLADLADPKVTLEAEAGAWLALACSGAAVVVDALEAAAAWSPSLTIRCLGRADDPLLRRAARGSVWVAWGLVALVLGLNVAVNLSDGWLDEIELAPKGALLLALAWAALVSAVSPSLARNHRWARVMAWAGTAAGAATVVLVGWWLHRVSVEEGNQAWYRWQLPPAVACLAVWAVWTAYVVTVLLRTRKRDSLRLGELD